ncbi:hypothetical protein A2U01_0036071, partial [Trifolium medium]|nr:hypothetical protein [Trifolium medium]
IEILDEALFTSEWSLAEVTFEGSSSTMKSLFKECRIHIFKQEIYMDDIRCFKKNMDDIQFTNPFINLNDDNHYSPLSPTEGEGEANLVSPVSQIQQLATALIASGDLQEASLACITVA